MGHKHITQLRGRVVGADPLDVIATGPQHELVFDLTFAYFNSSTAKALMNLFEMLERAADGGTRIVINWHIAPDDDAMREFGEDFSLDISACRFNLCADLG